MVDVENLLNENQPVISFRTVPKGRGNVGEVRKHRTVPAAMGF